MTATKEYQQQIAVGLKNFFPAENVDTEWTAIRGSRDIYCPRLDIAVGPFAVEEHRYEPAYDQLFDVNQLLIQRFVEIHNCNLADHPQPRSQEHHDYVLDQPTETSHLNDQNRNARCFLAIEIENKVTRKHLLGGFINAAALGRIGIGIAYDADKLKAFLNARRYLLFLHSKGKNSFSVSNLLIMTKEQVLEALV